MFQDKEIKIEHLVFSGGGHILFKMLGIVESLLETNTISFSNIKTIYGTSAGSIIGAMLCIGYHKKINHLINYFIKRPWHTVFSIQVSDIISLYQTKGIFSADKILTCFKPLFDANDIPLTITLSELYILSSVELHFITFEVNAYKTVDISHLSHPHLSVLSAIQMSCGIPLLVTPVCIDGQCFIDGGVEYNYPLEFCIRSGHDINTILGFKTVYDDNPTEETTGHITSESNLLEFAVKCLTNMIYNVGNAHMHTYTIPYEIECINCHISFSHLQTIVCNEELRQSLFDDGKRWQFIKK